ncbi:uncharacterized protein [Palaemon carinicauda]|uniref:uncharacterized protein n=1 Tax=Palaemon carinicauda TaxID=392227 RepID=UPI0035B68AD1
MTIRYCENNHTGACHSLLARDLFRTRQSLSTYADVRLVTSNGSAIPTYGYKNITLPFGNCKFNFKYIFAEVTLPILGADFLSHFHLLVDVTHRRLVNADSYLSTPLQPTSSHLAFHISAPTDAYAHLLTLYPEVFRPELRITPTAPAKHGIFPISRHLALKRLASAKQTFVEMEEMGLYQKASNTWSSPLHIVLKQDGSLRPCRDTGI